MPLSVINSIIGAASQNSTNKTNLRIARETNDANLQLAKMQNDWNVDLWNKTNEYNTYANQIQRWKDAGMNPNTFQGDTSNTQTLQSADLANQQQPTTGQQAYEPKLNSDGVSAFMNYQVGRANADAALQTAKANEENAKTAQLRAQIERERLPYEQSSLDAQARLGFQNASNASLLLPYQMDAQRAQTLLWRSEREQAESSAKFLRIQKENAEREGNWIDRRMSALIRNMNAQSYNSIMSGNLSSANIDVAIQEAKRIWADKNLKNWESKEKALEYKLHNQGIYTNGSQLGTLLGFFHRYSWVPDEIVNGQYGSTPAYQNPYLGK